MKNYIKIIGTCALVMGFAQFSIAQQQVNPSDIHFQAGMEERPAIENLIEVWDGDWSTVAPSNGAAPVVSDNNGEGKPGLANSATTMEQVTSIDSDKGKYDDPGNPPTIVLLVEKQAIIHENKELILYPNPSQGLINVSLKNSDVATIEIFNMSGALVYKCMNGAVASQNIQIDLSNTARGVYMLHVTSTESVSTKKFALR